MPFFLGVTFRNPVFSCFHAPIFWVPLPFQSCSLVSNGILAWPNLTRNCVFIFLTWHVFFSAWCPAWCLIMYLFFFCHDTAGTVFLRHGSNFVPFFFCAQHSTSTGFFFFLFYYILFLGSGWAGRGGIFRMHQLQPLSRICLFSFTFSRVCSDTCQAHLFSYENVVLCPHTRVSYVIMHCNLETRAWIHASSFTVAFPRLVYLPVYPSSVIFFKIQWLEVCVCVYVCMCSCSWRFMYVYGCTYRIVFICTHLLHTPISYSSRVELVLKPDSCHA